MYCIFEAFNPFIHVEKAHDEIWKLVNLVSHVSQQRGIPGRRI